MGLLDDMRGRIAPWAGLSGFGFLVALVLLAVHRTSPFVFAYGLERWEPFTLGVFGGLAIGGTALVLRHARRSCDGASAPSRLTRVLSALAGALLVLAGWAGAADPLASYGVRLTVLGSAWSFGGLLVGAGIVVLLASWARRYAALPVRQALVASGLSLLVAATLSGLAIFAAAEAAWALVVVETLGASALLLACPARVEGPEAVRLRDASFGSRARSLASATWRPVVGALICVFIFGFTWNTDLLGVPINDGAILSAEKVAGLFAAGALMLLLVRFARGRDVQTTLFNIVLPILLIAFIVRPYLFNIDLDPFALALIGFAREMGFALFLASAWVALASGSCGFGVLSGFALGAFASGCGVVALFGTYGLRELGGLSGFMGAILFVVYLVVVVIETVVTRGRASASDARAMERIGFERFIETRCDALTERFGLTPRERDIVAYLAQGHSYAYIAGELVVSENTVRTHVRNMYRKMGVSSREELLELIHRP